MRVVSSVVADVGPLVALLEPRHPLAFLREGEGIIGLGVAARLEFRGPDRFAAAATAWRQFCASASIEDGARMPGSGLTAFGSFAFAADSAAASVLIVPRVTIGRRGGQCFITTLDGAERPQAEPLGPQQVVHFGPGEFSGVRFAAAVRTALERIEGGAVGKVVLARDLVGVIPAEADLRHPLARLAAAYPQTFTYAVEGLIGASPETLIRSEAGIIDARVLAGSAARGADADADARAADALLASEKDLGEHDFALRSVLDALAPHSAALSTSAAAFALQLPNLWHLASDITGRLADEASALDLVAALHPTAAVAGTPTDAATELIAELEPFDRGRYAGPVGWVDADGDGEWAIALRCAQLTDGEVRAYAGAGIVPESDPESELAETELKLRPVLEAFGPTEEAAPR